jgi:hypothetical protein
MGTSALRVAVVAAAVILGAVGLSKAIASNPSKQIVPASQSAAQASGAPSPTPTKPLPTKKGSLTRGVTVKILNGSGALGLAGDTTNTIKAAHLGYNLKPPGDAPQTSTTVIYYRPGFQRAAQHLSQKYFPNATLQQSTKYKADLVVVLGADFAATASPSASA